jgi:hypothetical protein
VPQDIYLRAKSLFEMPVTQGTEAASIMMND